MDGQIVALIITTVGGFATLVFKSIHDQSSARQRHEQERHDQLEDAALAKAEREEDARLVREKLELAALEFDAKTAEQTVAITKKIDEARTHMVQRADLAFTEANDVNTKIAKLYQMQLQQSATLEQFLRQGQRQGS